MKILVIEDDSPISELICMNLEAAGYCPVPVDDGLKAQKLLQNGQADDAALALVDIMLPGKDGFALMEDLQKARMPVIYLTAKADVLSKVHGLKSGAEDYIVKPFEFEELSARIRSLGRRSGSYEDDNLLFFGDISYDSALRILHAPKGEFPLSVKEGLLLEVFLRNPGKIMHRMVIFSRVWGVDAPVEEGNLDTYIHFIRKQLLYTGSTLQLRTVRGVGYILEQP